MHDVLGSQLMISNMARLTLRLLTVFSTLSLCLISSCGICSLEQGCVEVLHCCDPAVQRLAPARQITKALVLAQVQNYGE